MRFTSILGNITVFVDVDANGTADGQIFVDASLFSTLSADDFIL